MKLDLLKVPELQPQALPTEHPVRMLFKNWPKLAGVPKATMLFRLILRVFQERLAKAPHGLPAKLDAVEARRALMFFENIPTDVIVNGEIRNLYGLYRESVDQILGPPGPRPPIPPRQQCENEFSMAIAVLMNGIRRARHA